MPDLHIDHIVYATVDVEKSAAELEERLGVRPSPGGKHVGLGTHNALLSLGDAVYLEVIGPDPDQPEPQRPRPFGVDSLEEARLESWAAKAPDLDARVARARAGGYDPGTIADMSRDTPEGQRLDWRLTLRAEPAGDGLVPFLIDWGSTPSPALTAAKGCSIVELRAEHPDPAAVRTLLEALGEPLDVARGPQPRLWAILDTPRGRVELR